MQIFAEHTINSGFSISQKGPKISKGWVKTWSKVGSKLGPSMLRNMIEPSFDSKNGKCCLLYFFSCLLTCHSPCRKKISFEKQKRKEEENLDQALTPQKAIFGPNFDSTTYMYLALSSFCFFCSVFLPSLFYSSFMFCFLVFVSLSCLLSLFSLHEKNNIKIFT